MTLNLTNERRHGSHHQFITSGGSNNRPKFTTRHLAALGFLSNIPMANVINTSTIPCLTYTILNLFYFLFICRSLRFVIMA